jgi:ABC-type glutathione transport system ATPase component
VQGATWSEAVQSILNSVYGAALSPVINFLTVAGVVHIPGMMAGQILAGQDPITAAAYQLLTFVLIASTSCLSVHCMARLAIATLADTDSHRLRHDMISAVQVKEPRKWPTTVRQAATSAKQELWASKDTLTSINGSTTKKSPVRKVKVSSTISVDDDDGENVLTVKEMPVPRSNTEISFRVRYDDRIAIVGPSGAGKSQVLRTLAGLEDVDRSKLSLFDISASSISMAEWRSHAVLVPQDRPTSLEGTPNEFFMTACIYESQQGKLSKGNKNVIAGHRKDPHEYAIDWGLDAECFNKNWSSLSGDESQRAMLAIVLALQPDILLLDESMNAMDSVTSKSRSDTDLRIPVTMVSHASDLVARFCNHCISLEPTNTCKVTDKLSNLD